MDDNQTGRRSADQIDAPMLWILIRAGEFLYAVVFAKMVYLTRGTESFTENAISAAGLLLMLGLFLHRVVTGRADAAGIQYRRYFRWKTLPWTEVQEIQWKGARLRVLVKGKKKPRAVLEFLLNPWDSLGAYWAHRLGADIVPPGILERIHALPVETPPIISAPPHGRWFRRAILGVVILFVLVVLVRLLLPSSGTPH